MREETKENNIRSFPPGIQFRYPWRKYQQRVLEELEEHLADRHLHIIAPPGSGKTVLGLEIAIRLNQPTLILAPTIAIRDQWIQRLCDLFLNTHHTPEWISRDIRKPAFITVSTYQGLHAACTSRKGMDSNALAFEKTVQSLADQHIRTIIADEAHHLKNSWWYTLNRLKKKLDPVIVGLTATPPYDVSATEWQRYISLNGPVDTEISVPELIREGDLCPHQDYIYFCKPTSAEKDKIDQFRHDIRNLYDEISTDPVLHAVFKNLPAYQAPEAHFEWIYENISVYSAILVFLQAGNEEIPASHLDLIGDPTGQIPALDYEWMEILLEFYLHKGKDVFPGQHEHQQNLENKLRRYGASDQKKISLVHNRKIRESLTTSISKLDGIKKIVDSEYQNLGSALRMVILADYIHKEFLVQAPGQENALNKTGVVPIFEKLRRENIHHQKIGVLTGSLVIIPSGATDIFWQKTRARKLAGCTCVPLEHDGHYFQVQIPETGSHYMIPIMTEIFLEGHVEILIGTKALLGEGWDAPAVNSLVLASFVGSFVLSNQMRGRAIRIQKDHPSKTGNIWHLVCLDPTSPTGGDDMELLKKRCKTFVGIYQESDNGIENGITRMELPELRSLFEDTDDINRTTFIRASNRQTLREKWERAIKKGIYMREEIKIPFRGEKPYHRIKTMYLNRTIAYVALQLFFAVLAFCQEIIVTLFRSVRSIHSPRDILYILIPFCIAGILFFGKKTYKTLQLYILYRDISKDIEKMGTALLNSLVYAGVIQNEKNHIRVITSHDKDGAVYCHMEGGSTFERSVFIRGLQEMVGTIQNPRYIMVRKSKVLIMLTRKDYHAVPEEIGRHKKYAEYFQSRWKEQVDDCDLVYTRTRTGRKHLLKARLKALSTHLADDTEHVSKWY